MKIEKIFLIHNIVYCFNFSTGNQCLQACIQISAPKSGLLHLAGQPNFQKGRSAKVKDGIISETIIIGTISVD
jgi:hypothetical protein